MSRGLGPIQRHALAALEEHRDGLLTAELATLIDCTERRTRTVIGSLVERRMVLVEREGHSQRVSLPDHSQLWVRRMACVCCGDWSGSRRPMRTAS